MAYYCLPMWNPVLKKVVLSMPQRHNGGEEWSTPCPSHFTTREESPYPLNKRLGGPTACLDISKKRKIACLYWGPKPVSCSL